MVRCATEGGVERLFRTAEARGAGRAAAQAMLLRRELMGAPLPRSALGDAQQRRGGAVVVRELEVHWAELGLTHRDKMEDGDVNIGAVVANHSQQ
jgi:hypothetical protein